jgi:hypothetical protein
LKSGISGTLEQHEAQDGSFVLKKKKREDSREKWPIEGLSRIGKRLREVVDMPVDRQATGNETDAVPREQSRFFR